MMIRLLLVPTVTIVLALAVTPARSQLLCGRPSTSKSTEAPELKLQEKELTIQSALESVAWLEKDAWDVIRRQKTTQDLLDDTEGFGIPFPNSVMIAKGVLLRQRALLERERLEVVTLKHKMRQGTVADIEKQKGQFAAARRQFCKFLESALYVD